MQVLTKLSMESAKTVLFRTKLTMLPLSAARDEGLVYQLHQFGQCVEAGNEKRWNTSSQMMTKRTQSTIAEAAIKEIESFSEFLPNVLDTNARTLALRMYHLELSENAS